MSVIAVIARFRLPLLWAGALACGVASVVLARSYLADRIADERRRLLPDRQAIEIVVAKRDLPAGAKLDADTAAVRRVAAALLPEGVLLPERFPGVLGRRLRGPIRSGEPIFSAMLDTAAVRRVAAALLPEGVLLPERFPGVLGRRLRGPIRSGEPIFSAMLDDAGPGALSARVRQGIRALTIAVDEVNSVSGMLRPGDRIDLVFTVRSPLAASSSDSPESTQLLMQDILVLATGQRFRDEAERGRDGDRRFATITVEVSPEQAQRLILAQRTGRVTALLRHPDDPDHGSRPALDLAGLLGVEASRSPARRRPAPELIVGGRGPIGIAEPAFASAAGTTAEAAHGVMRGSGAAPERSAAVSRDRVTDFARSDRRR